MPPKPQNRLQGPFKSPFFAASGCFGYGPEYGWLGTEGLGGVFSKGITRQPKAGNPAPRLAETPCGLLNSIGLENPGIEAFLHEYADSLLQLGVPVFVNLEGDTPEEYAFLAEQVERSGKPFAGLELNLSCPNVERGGLELGTDPRTVRQIVEEVRAITERPLIAKLTPNATSVVDLAEAALAGGADALTLCNTLLGMRIDIWSRKPSLGSGFGGLSGPAVRPVILRIVYQVWRAFQPIIFASGGITRAEDAMEYLLAGARYFQIGTALFRNPGIFAEISQNWKVLLQRLGAQNEEELLGAAHAADRVRA